MRIRIFEKTSDIDQLSNSFSKKCIISYQEFQIFKVLLPKGLLVTELHIQRTIHSLSYCLQTLMDRSCSRLKKYFGSDNDDG